LIGAARAPFLTISVSRWNSQGSSSLGIGVLRMVSFLMPRAQVAERAEPVLHVMADADSYTLFRLSETVS